MRSTPRLPALSLIGIGFASLLFGCAARGPVTVPESQLVGLFKNVKGCREKYAAMDEKIDAAGVRNPAFYRVPGFPYLRTDRLMASFRNDLGSFDEASGWVRRMREFDQEAREFEYEALGMNAQERAITRFDFLVCSQGLAGLELEVPGNLDLLKSTAVVPDDYSTGAQLLGLYPLSAPLLKSRISAFEASVRTEFSQPVDALLDRGPQLLWQVAAVEDLSLIPTHVYKTSPDELGLPGLVDSAWRAIAEANAPQLAGFASTSAGRQLGTPMWTRAGLAIDTAQPQVFYQIGFVRFGMLNLIQVDYFLWFTRPGDAAAGSDAAPVDGMIWRVTLDEHMKPLAYDSLRASGSEHFWFAAQTRLQRQPEIAGQPPFFPQDGLAPAAPRLVLDGRHGGLRKVQSADAPLAGAEVRRYPLQRYEELYRLPLPDGGIRSLFDTAGLIPGTEVPAPVWMRASGIVTPGSLRHLAHLPTTYIGRRHFDDPRLLQAVFVPIPAPPLPVQLQFGAGAPVSLSPDDVTR